MLLKSLLYFFVAISAFANPCGFIKVAGQTPQTFVNKNQEGGFLRNDDAIYFVAPNQQAVYSMAQHLDVGVRNLYPVQGLPGWSGTMVSPSPRLSLFSKTNHGLYSPYHGVRCYTACLMGQSFMAGATDNRTLDFAIWAQSPLTYEESPYSPRKGTVIAVDRDAKVFVPADHVATFETERVLFQKQSPKAEDPFELVTFDRFQREWPKSKFPNQKHYFQNETLVQYMNRNQANISQEARDAVSGIISIERIVGPYLLPKPFGPLDYNKISGAGERAYLDLFDRDIPPTEKRADQLYQLANQKLKEMGDTGKSLKTPESFIWHYVKSRSQSLMKSPSPY